MFDSVGEVQSYFQNSSIKVVWKRIDSNVITVILSGLTFPVKTLLKEGGFTWMPATQTWVKSFRHDESIPFKEADEALKSPYISKLQNLLKSFES